MTSWNYGFIYKFNNIKVKIKDEFGFESFFQQVSIIIDITQHKKTFLLLLALTLGRV